MGDLSHMHFADGDKECVMKLLSSFAAQIISSLEQSAHEDLKEYL